MSSWNLEVIGTPEQVQAAFNAKDDEITGLVENQLFSAIRKSVMNSLGLEEDLNENVYASAQFFSWTTNPNRKAHVRINCRVSSVAIECSYSLQAVDSVDNETIIGTPPALPPATILLFEGPVP